MTRKYLQNGNIYKFGVLNVQRCKTFIIFKDYLFNLRNGSVTPVNIIYFLD